MTKGLKKKYAEQLDDSSLNWVTGVSSPWVQGYTITKVSQTDDMHTELGLKIETTATNSPSVMSHG